METLLPLDLPTLLGAAGNIAAVILLGFGFGFVLEQAGFGDSRKLAAQFYFRDMTVFKVMFTAIMVAMVLLLLASAFQLLDFSRLWVNPTYLWPGILGGLILGIGFIVGGYCPGTSLVALATLKLDGIAFLTGVLLGLFAFGELVPGFWRFFISAGALGRFTLADWLQADPGLVAFWIVLIGLLCFIVVERVEAQFGHQREVRR